MITQEQADRLIAMLKEAMRVDKFVLNAPLGTLERFLNACHIEEAKRFVEQPPSLL